MTELHTDLLIVGAGPAGLFATYYAGMRSLEVVLIDSLPQVGGQLGALYPEKYIFDVAGFPAVKGRDLVAGLSQQAQTADAEILLNEECTTLEDHAGGFRVTTSGAKTIYCGAVLITAGIGRFTPRALPVVDDFAGSGVEPVVGPPDLYATDDVVVVGGGDSAIDWANALVPHARSVTLVHRRARFTAHESSVAQLLATSARVHTDSEIVEVHGDEAVTAVTLRNARTEATVTVDASVLIPALGHIASLGPLVECGLDIGDRHIEVNTDMSTSRRGVFAAGDIATYPGKVQLMVVGFGEAATAVNNIAVHLRPDEHLFPGHSSEKVHATTA